MKDMSYENKIIGAEVMSTPYGIGHVTRFVLRDDDKYYIADILANRFPLSFPRPSKEQQFALAMHGMAK